MTNMAVSFHRLAGREYDHAFAWYARRSTRIAQRFRLEITYQIQRISQSPDQGGFYRGPYRWRRFGASPI